jgi:hypothetical protein
MTASGLHPAVASLSQIQGFFDTNNAIWRFGEISNCNFLSCGALAMKGLLLSSSSLGVGTVRCTCCGRRPGNRRALGLVMARRSSGRCCVRCWKQTWLRCWESTLLLNSLRCRRFRLLSQKFHPNTTPLGSSSNILL